MAGKVQLAGVLDSKSKNAGRVIGEPFVIWDGAGTTKAPTLTYYSIGFNNDGVSTANLYIYDLANDTWRDTTQTLAGFFGV